MLCKLKKYSVRPNDADVHNDFIEVWMKIEESIKKFESKEDPSQQSEEKNHKNNK
jgi:hypothetical protein